MNVNNSNFGFSITIKLDQLPTCDASKIFPGVSDLAVNSRSFSTYVECVTSAKAFMEDVVTGVNKNGEMKLTVSAEINPAHSGVETRSRDWSDDEVARFWLFDKIQEGLPNIRALGQARIFALEKSNSVLLN